MACVYKAQTSGAFDCGASLGLQPFGCTARVCSSRSSRTFLLHADSFTGTNSVTRLITFLPTHIPNHPLSCTRKTHTRNTHARARTHTTLPHALPSSLEQYHAELRRLTSASRDEHHRLLGDPRPRPHAHDPGPGELTLACCAHIWHMRLPSWPLCPLTVLNARFPSCYCCVDRNIPTQAHNTQTP